MIWSQFDQNAETPYLLQRNPLNFKLSNISTKPWIIKTSPAPATEEWHVQCAVRRMAAHQNAGTATSGLSGTPTRKQFAASLSSSHWSDRRVFCYSTWKDEALGIIPCKYSVCVCLQPSTCVSRPLCPFYFKRRGQGEHSRFPQQVRRGQEWEFERGRMRRQVAVTCRAAAFLFTRNTQKWNSMRPTPSRESLVRATFWRDVFMGNDLGVLCATKKKKLVVAMNTTSTCWHWWLLPRRPPGTENVWTNGRKRSYDQGMPMGAGLVKRTTTMKNLFNSSLKEFSPANFGETPSLVPNTLKRRLNPTCLYLLREGWWEWDSLVMGSCKMCSIDLFWLFVWAGCKNTF